MIAVARRLGQGVLATWLLLAGYVAAGLAGGLIPANRGWTPPAAGVRIWIVDNGVHTAIVVPKAAAGSDWRPLLPARDLRDPRYAGYGYAAFGWGDAKFYRETPTWGDVGLGTMLAAAVGSDATLVHVDHVPLPVVDRSTRSVVLRPAEYRRLAAFIRASFAAAPVGEPGYYALDAFYTGRGRYSAVRTCNAWTGDALRYAGVRVGAWTPFAMTVMRWF